jgi:hypothetical protein
LRVGLVAAKTPPKYRISSFYVRATGFSIPPNEKDFIVTADREMPVDATILRFIPHMHLRGRQFAIDFTYPDGKKLRPIEIERWHPDWQFAYDLVDPIAVPKGTILQVTGDFDNSAGNRFNPDPNKKVFEGPQIFNEMCDAVVEWYVPVQE